MSNTTCPNCSDPLRSWYSLSREEAIAQCVNEECVLTAIEGTGNTVQNALDDFVGKSLLKNKPKKR